MIAGPPPSLGSFGLAGRSVQNGGQIDTYWRVRFTGTADSWTLRAPNGKTWTGGAIAGTGFDSPEFEKETDPFYDGNWVDEWAACAEGPWHLTLVRSGQSADYYYTFTGGQDPAGIAPNSYLGNMLCPW